MTMEKAKNKKKRWIIRGCVLLVLAALIIPGLYSALKVQVYTIEAEKIENPIRLAVVSDLHSCEYGKKAEELLQEIAAQKPDVLLLCGDIFDDVLDDTNTEHFLSGISGKYPCYYVTGNHEYWSGMEKFDIKMSILEKYGIPRLSGTLEQLTVNGETLNICGVDDPDASLIPSDEERVYFDKQVRVVSELSQNGNYTVLLSHRPERFELYSQYGFDLVVSGHAHGGQWRIPLLLNGLYAPNQGFFPEYAGGEYRSGETVMIVSRGLARESTRVPRFYNRPELVVIDLK